MLALVAGVIIFFSFKRKSSENLKAEIKYQIIQKWELPEDLEEVSGIVWIKNNLIACVQDEEGKIFVYNLKSSKVENSISFAGSGDYEGITVIEDDAFVLRSDGVIFEVVDFMGANPQVKEFVTKANQLPEINIEGLCADPANNRLLLAVKERKDSPSHKEIFAFDLDRKDSEKNPLYRVNLADPIFSEVNEKLENKFSPGEIGIHPQTGEHFILDGSRPKLLIAGEGNAPKELFMFRLEDFPNPEGLTFNPEGDLFISNEAEDAPANILQVKLNRKSN